MITSEKRRRAAELIEEAGAILKKAQDEKRDLTPAEAAEFDRKHDEARAINQELAGTYLSRREAQDAAAAYLSKSQGAAARGQSGGAQEPDNYPFLRNAEWSDRSGAHTTRALAHGESVREYVESRGRHDPEIAGVQPGQILRALVLGARDDVERRALAAGVDTAGGYAVPEILSASIIDVMRAQSVLSRAGAMTVPLNGETVVAKWASDPTPAWRAENAAVAESDPTFGSVRFQPKALAVLVKVSRELLEDGLNIEASLVNVLGRALALELDRAGLIGEGAANEPEGMYNVPGIGSVTANSTPSYDHLLSARTELLTNNSRPPTAFIMSPRTEGQFSKLRDGEGISMPVPPALQGIPFLSSTQIPNTYGGGTDSIVLTGDFQRMWIGMRTQLRIEVLRERYADNL